MQGSLTTNSSGTSSGEVGEVPVGWTFVLFFLAICTGDFELVGGCQAIFEFGQVIQIPGIISTKYRFLLK
jgi:hypothetical protein